MKLFDTHVHLTDDRFDADRQAVIDGFEAEHILGVIEAATDEADSKAAVDLASNNTRVYAAVGIHPHEAKDVSGEYIRVLADLAKNPKVVAIGEIGLDYHYDFSPRNIQQDIFKAQIALAKDLDLPIIIHNREATKDTMDILKSFAPLRGVMHCFSGSPETVQETIRLGLHVSFTGTLTFANAHKVQEAFLAVPLDRVMAETDGPYLAPVPVRGKRNEPKYVKHVIEKMAELHGISPGEMADINIKNAKHLFGVLGA